MKRPVTVMAATLLAAASLAAAAFAGPSFDKDGKLVVPEGRDRWPVLGTTFALSYEGDGGTTFNTVRMDPASYDQYIKSGKYPVGSMLDLEVRGPMTEIAPAKGGKTQGKVLGRSIHIKDEKGGPGTWTFYNFSGDGKTGSPIARTQACYTCHQDNAKDDTTFTQFYPSMQEAREKAAKAQ
jgi:Cytochrome P460